MTLLSYKKARFKTQKARKVLLPRKAKLLTKVVFLLLPFVSTYFCEHILSNLVDVKAKTRNGFAWRNDKRIAVSETSSQIPQLFTETKNKMSH